MQYGYYTNSGSLSTDNSSLYVSASDYRLEVLDNMFGFKTFSTKTKSHVFKHHKNNLQPDSLGTTWTNLPEELENLSLKENYNQGTKERV